MTVSVLVEGKLKDGERKGFTEICREAFKVTRDYYDKYLKFRTEDGTLETIASLCENAPSIRVFDIIDT